MKPTYFESAEAFSDWLREHHDKESELLVGFNKVATQKGGLKRQEAVEEALCYGWIDGIGKSLGDEAYTIRFTPRKPRSNWSKINTKLAERLIDEGRMRAAGLKEVEAAKADGRWDAAYDSPSTSTIPDDFVELLEKHPKAKATFESMNKSNRYAISYRLSTAKRPETRERRMKAMIEMMDRGEVFHLFDKKGD